MDDLPQVKRHFGLDWLRISAFALLILYHTAMHFGPGNWVIKSNITWDWLALPLAAVAPWRLMVLFAVSGFASAAMIGKFHHITAFFKERSKRLLIPLLFGIAVIVPPQSWVRLVSEGNYGQSYLSFWFGDDFRFGSFLGHTLPHWEHLWFLGYLWAYTALLAIGIAFVPQWSRLSDGIANWLSRGHRLLFAPLILMILMRVALTAEGFNSPGMFDDWIGDAHYLPTFFIGYLIATRPILWSAVTRVASTAASVSLFAFIIIGILLLTSGGVNAMSPSAFLLDIMADTAMAWAMVPVALQLAQTLFNRDHRWRQPLAQAIFPAYLVHQTVIVVFGWYLLRFNLPGGVAFAAIATAVVLASFAAWQLAKHVPLAGTLLGLPHKARRPSPKPALA